MIATSATSSENWEKKKKKALPYTFPHLANRFFPLGM
jgi:hypothetical protein